MSHLEVVHLAAIEHTKSKVWEDTYRYLGCKEQQPSIDQFLVERKNYLTQIWINVWVNKASNQIPRKEKVEWLEKLGYEVEGVDRKLINHSFRQEIREYQPFDVWLWVQQRFDDIEEWDEIYKKAREQFLTNEEEKLHQEEKMKLWQKIDVKFN